MPSPIYKKFGLSKEHFRKLLIENYHTNGLSQAQLAKKFSCHVSAIENWFFKFDLTTRTQSRAMANRWSKQANLSEIEMEQLNGWLLSDGSLSASKYSARFTIGLKHRHALEDIKNSITGMNFTPIWMSKKTKCYHMKSHSYTNLKQLHSAWYAEQKKRLPSELCLTPTTVYYWFLGDGCRLKYAIQLSTESFTEKENRALIDKIQTLGIVCSITARNRIRIAANSVNKFYNYIGECKHKEYVYKWRQGND